MRHKLKRSAKEPVDHGGARREPGRERERGRGVWKLCKWGEGAPQGGMDICRYNGSCKYHRDPQTEWSQLINTYRNVSPEFSPWGSAPVRCNLSLVRVASLKPGQNTRFNLMSWNANTPFKSHRPFLCACLEVDGPVHSWTLATPSYWPSLAKDVLPECTMRLHSQASHQTLIGRWTRHSSALLLQNIAQHIILTLTGIWKDDHLWFFRGAAVFPPEYKLGHRKQGIETEYWSWK